MTTTLSGYFEDEIQTPTEPVVVKTTSFWAKRHNRPNTDIKLWLLGNAPRDLEELKSLRYCLYHRCGRNGFKVLDKKSKDYFTINGRAGRLLIVSTQARRYVLWQLRELRKRRPWHFRSLM
jgi:hypothetical protein